MTKYVVEFMDGEYEVEASSYWFRSVGNVTEAVFEEIPDIKVASFFPAELGIVVREWHEGMEES